MFFNRVVAILVVLSFPIAGSAQDNTPKARIDRVFAATSLDDLNSKPWHATLSMTLFDKTGKNPIEATAEYWKSGDDSLRVITVGSDVETTLRHEGKNYRGVSGSAVPYLASAVFDAFLHPGSSPSELESSTPEARNHSFGKVKLDCIMLSQPIKGLATAPLGLFPTYCMDTGTDTLRLTYDFGSRGINVVRGGKFLDHAVAAELAMTENNIVVARAKIGAMGTFTPAPETFQPGPQLVQTGSGVARISGSVAQGQILNKIQPIYPAEAKSGHISGSVVLRAIIGRDGHIHILRVMSAPDSSLAIAALAAVRQWTYKPYLLNGEPTEVDTTIVVNFNLNR
jgi:TonB family protein